MSMLESLLHDELGADRKLVPGETHRLASDRLRHARHLEHDAARLDDRDPVVRRSLAGAHPDLGWLLGDRLVREDPDPDTATALDVVRHGASSGRELTAGQPADLLRHAAEVAAADGGAALGQAGAPAALHLAVLDALWHQHRQDSLPLGSSADASSAGPTSGAGAAGGWVSPVVSLAAAALVAEPRAGAFVFAVRARAGALAEGFATVAASAVSEVGPGASCGVSTWTASTCGAWASTCGVTASAVSTGVTGSSTAVADRDSSWEARGAAAGRAAVRGRAGAAPRRGARGSVRALPGRSPSCSPR